MFYDYDEIGYLTDFKFRRIPKPRDYDDEMSADPWFSVGPHDVFPEQFATFLFADPGQRALFEELHGDLLDPAFWTAMLFVQALLGDGAYALARTGSRAARLQAA